MDLLNFDKTDIKIEYSISKFNSERANENCEYFEYDQQTGMERYLAKRNIEASIYPAYTRDEAHKFVDLTDFEYDVYLGKINLVNAVLYTRKKCNPLTINQKIKKLREYILESEFKYRISFRMDNGEISRSLGFNSFNDLKEFLSFRDNDIEKQKLNIKRDKEIKLFN